MGTQPRLLEERPDRMISPRHFVLLLTCSLTLMAQTPGASCCEMKLDSSKKPAGVVWITVTNINQPLITVMVGSGETITVQVTSDTGQDVERTAYGKRVLTKERAGSMINRELKMGESTSQDFDLRQLFELKSGTYHVAISRDVIIGEFPGPRVALHAASILKMP